ncbi:MULTISPECIES: hypothetical protein [unclassified Rathayibacter]|uniref:hypothetical protein n=1 Tax=unclassified Rathayibacter TaxID=2609250 RepID=UPI00188CF15A|nr:MULTISPECIES: hypothetical protein [unclassified Rathayibacter]MBF4461645.1 hypothetical protein [Rathayibacter sp. VKM Ac-2879]MBF4503056.1 hypothetical protein [Rathayibacter sp. VKM Ac-2878]
MKSYTPAPIPLGVTFGTGAIGDYDRWSVVGVYAQVVIAETTGGKRRNFSRSFVAYRLAQEEALLRAS